MAQTIEKLARKYVNDVYSGDTDFIDEAENVLSWLFEKPLASRLTTAEKEAIRKEYAKTYPNDIDRSVTGICIAAVLERIFGKEFFEQEGE